MMTLLGRLDPGGGIPGAFSWILTARFEGPRVGESFSSSLLPSFGRRYVESVKADEFDVTDMVDA